MAQGDRAGGVDLVVADAEVGVGGLPINRPGLEPGAVGLQGGAPAQRPVGPDRVVVMREGVELGLQPWERPTCPGGERKLLWARIPDGEITPEKGSHPKEEAGLYNRTKFLSKTFHY